MTITPSSAASKLGFDVIRDRLRDYTRSTLGEERIARMQPARTLGWLRTELERVAELQQAFTFDDPVPLHHLLDLRDVLRRAAPEEAYVSTDDLTAVRLALVTLRRLRGYFQQRSAKYPRLAQSTETITPLPDLEEHIDRIVDEQGGGLRDDASPELRRLRRRIVQRQEDLRRTLQSELRKAIKAGHATEEQPTIRNGRMVIPVRAEAKRKVEGFVQDTSGSGQTVYIEPAVCLDLNNEVRELQSDERREVERILRVATGRLRQRMDALRDNVRVLSQFDLLQAKARLAEDLGAVVPTLNDTGEIDLHDARNPVLMLHVKRQRERGEEARDVVPLDLALGGDYHTLVITGPNAGGKTVAMKTVGLLTLMLAYGLPIPCDDASRMSLFDHLFVDIGDEQSIEEDLSTFSSHVSNLKEMLRRAGPNSMVLIDEAGTGTDPEQGGALAQAVLERLTAAQARTIVTTHLGALKAFAHETSGVENGSMAFDQATLSPTYRFQAGVPGSSYAFEIAQRIGLDAAVLERARTLIGAQGAALEDLVTTFEQRTQDLEARLAETEETLRQAEHEKQQYDARMGKLRKERDKIRQQALEEAERIVQEANARVERTIREIKEAEAEREATKRAREQLEAFKGEVEEERSETEVRQKERRRAREAREVRQHRATPGGDGAPAPGGPLEVGDQVVLDDGSTAAEVLELDDGEAVITAGPLRMRVDVDRLTKVGGPKEQQVTVRQTGSGGSDLASLRARTEIDLRGDRVDEALPKVERLLDEALAAGLDRVEILHGKGTGALRQAIHEYLSASPDVVDFDDAAWNQGGAGVTVVRLR
jgi:DNA mismatch repair protein MutS2